MDRVIIGIHGLNNKPPAHILKNWWMLSLYDGLSAIGLPVFPLNFELLYWADLFYAKPLDVTITNNRDDLFITHPYKKLAPSSYPKISLRKQRSRERIEKIEDELFQNDRLLKSFEEISDLLIRLQFSDLDKYLNNHTGYGEATHRPVRDVILERLGNLLIKYRRNKIMIIAHSMGTIIAYDLLIQPDSPFHVDTFLTLGSPLAQPTLMDKFSPKNPVLEKMQTPEGIDKWFNFADLDDIIALDPTLGDDYAPNSRGVLPEDIFVNNQYRWEGSKNAHAIYGYLQTPAVSRRVYDFKVKDRSKAYRTYLNVAAWAYNDILRIPEMRRKKCPTRAERIKKQRLKRNKSQEFEFQANT